jgi:alkanesulfonate monooxygenase SsuD/methylene tetrahydromethanopterin reductase-like flavin-dependent oxidoreductase (luciferase family)
MSSAAPGRGLDVVMWPDRPWPELRTEWQHAERIGIRRGWVWDHLVLSGRSIWHDAYVTLSAAAAVTDRIGVGTMVTAPNFRHPVTTAKAALSLDAVSGGRFVLGLGAGGAGADAEALGAPPRSPAERHHRFTEFVEHTHRLLTESAPSLTGRWFTAREADVGGGTSRRLVVLGFGGERPPASVEAFRDCLGRYTESGVTQVAVLWPRGASSGRQLEVLEQAAGVATP